MPRAADPTKVRFTAYRTAYAGGVVLLVLAAGVVAVGCLYYLSHQRGYRAEVERQLLAIAELKVQELAAWRRERLADGDVASNNSAFSSLVRLSFHDPPDVSAQSHLQAWLNNIQKSYQYDNVRLLDANAIPRMTSPDILAPMPGHLAQDALGALRQKQSVFLDFHRDVPEGSVHLTVLTPVFDEQDGNKPLGVLALRIDPATYLYPFINRWPTASETAETLLVRRDGNDVLFLNELRFVKGTALSLRLPLLQTEVPAVRAALGQEGVVEGTDYRGMPTIAALRAVPGTPWLLVARISTAEVYGSLRERMWLTITVVGLLLLAMGVVASLAWRRQSLRVYKERARIADALRTKTALLEAQSETSIDGILAVDDQGKTLLSNARFGVMWGISQEVLDTRDDARMLHAVLGQVCDPDGFLAKVRQLYAHKAQASRDEISLKDGRIIDRYSSALVDADGTYFGRIWFFRDITDRKRAETQLREKTEELALTNEELTRFTYTVSHDLKSPLVTIKTFLGYLEKDVPNRDVERMGTDLSYIRTAADKMSRLLDELLELSRVGRKINPPVEAALQDIVKEALDLVAGRIALRKVQVQVTAEPIRLWGDRVRLVEAFQNLLDNAGKFMGDQASPHIEVGVQLGGEMVVLFVRDNGIGIDPRHQSRLFGLFEKLDPHTDGTGMGLALVRRVVEVHGGKIWVQSDGLGKGATFFFTLAGTSLGQHKEPLS